MVLVIAKEIFVYMCLNIYNSGSKNAKYSHWPTFQMPDFSGTIFRTCLLHRYVPLAPMYIKVIAEILGIRHACDAAFIAAVNKIAVVLTATKQ